MIKAQLAVPALLLILLMVACAPKSASLPQGLAPPAAPAPAQAPQAVPVAPVKPAWQVEWERALQAGKGEGTVVIYTSGLGGGVLQRGFKAAYGINAEFVSGPSGTLDQRVMTERRAGIYSVDISMLGTSSAIITFGSAGVLQPLREQLLLPEVTNPQMWQGGGLRWVDTAQTTTIACVSFVTGLITVNLNLVKPGEIKSWRDVLNPKWKNQIAMGDVLVQGPPQVWVQMMAKVLGWDYMRALARQEPIIVTDARLQVDWVARGKYALGLAARPEVVFDFWKLGVPIDQVTPEEGAYTNSGSGTINLLKNAPHPNAAKVFINWVLTKEAQTISAQATGYPSLRVDVPTTGLNPALVPDPKIKYVRADVEEVIVGRPQASQIAKEVFGHLKQ